MSKILSGFLLLFVFISCSNREEVEFYRGAEKNVSKVVALCETFRFPVSVGKLSDGFYVLRGPKEKLIAYNKIILAISPFLWESENNSSKFGVKDFFIPKKLNINPSEKGKEDTVLGSIDSYRYILHAERVITPELESNREIKLYYVSNPIIERQVELFLIDLKKANSDQLITKTAIDLGLESSLEIANIQPSLSVFEPFSFHVLNSERNLAGMQFLLLLLLFLLSGFILGLWWQRKA